MSIAWTYGSYSCTEEMVKGHEEYVRQRSELCQRIREEYQRKEQEELYKRLNRKSRRKNE